jgi:hypothetical protein
MRRIFLLATTLLLSGCAGSGFYSYLGDTFTLPFGANPNAAPGQSENFAKVHGAKIDQAEAPILFEPGDVWPLPPKAPPTLRDLQAKQAEEMKTGGGYEPLQPLPQLKGYEVPEQQPHPYMPGTSFPGGVVSHGTGGLIGTTGGTTLNTKGDLDNGPIIVPNGNGTSTVIAPNGAVTTIPTPGK